MYFDHVPMSFVHCVEKRGGGDQLAMQNGQCTPGFTDATICPLSKKFRKILKKTRLRFRIISVFLLAPNLNTAAPKIAPSTAV